MVLLKTVAFIWVSVICTGLCFGEIQAADDAPKPLTPEESAARVRLAPGFRLELIASEPLIREPSGVCWDERGRLFVSELHGYNLEGHLDVQELNKTGQLDHVVRRISANRQAQDQAMKDTFGTVKLLHDDDGDGRMDRASVFADRLPPVYGICPANGGIIVACAPDIVYLADRDGDGKAEVRQVLFTGFHAGALERGINNPQWGLDDWIYFGRGHTGGTITGPNLEKPTRLAGSDFRIKADGSAIEPVTGATGTFGHTFTEEGDRFTVSTSSPGLFVTPIPWRYLARNPDAVSPSAQHNAGNYQRIFPAAQPHPWRTKRAEDPGFFKYYRDRYGPGDSDSGGWFTSACGPIVYQDVAWPEEYRNQYFVCEPAGNLIHRAVMKREGPTLALNRAAEEQDSEFLASGDQWFHPIALRHGPEGAIYICDFYREIIEDYSAIPRYLQQQYGLVEGLNHGRIWKLSHREAPAAPPADMSRLTEEELADEIRSPHFWRRQTARRVLAEGDAESVAPRLAKMIEDSPQTSAVLNALYTLDALDSLRPQDALTALRHANAAVRRHGLQFAERWLNTRQDVFREVVSLLDDGDSTVLLQLALTLGESNNPEVLSTIVQLARDHGNVRWMPAAILSSLPERSGDFLSRLLVVADRSPGSDLRNARPLLEPLCRTIGSRRNEIEVSLALALASKISDTGVQRLCLTGFAAGLKEGRPLLLSPAGREALSRLVQSHSEEIRSAASEILVRTDSELRAAFVAEAELNVANLALIPEKRLAAVEVLGRSETPSATASLLAAWLPNTPVLRVAILDAIFARRERLAPLLDAIETKSILAGSLSAYQRVKLLEHDQTEIRERAARLLKKEASVNDGTFQRFASALRGPRDADRGEKVFRDHCAVCHRAFGIGSVVGPDLAAEFQRSEEAILQDILTPNAAISAGYSTYSVELHSGESYNGVLANESATSVTLRLPTGLEQIVLRRDISSIKPYPISLMPEALVDVISPVEVADLIGWLRTAGGQAESLSNRVVLFDEEVDMVDKLKQGGGRAYIEHADSFSGKVCLAITPLQRYSARIPNWRFPIRQHPTGDQYRYLRLAWKTRDGEGTMIELAADGDWPDARLAQRRYYAGTNTSDWAAQEVSSIAPRVWQSVTLDLWQDCGEFTLTGIAPTALGGIAYFDRIELLQTIANPEILDSP